MLSYRARAASKEETRSRQNLSQVKIQYELHVIFSQAQNNQLLILQHTQQEEVALSHRVAGLTAGDL